MARYTLTVAGRTIESTASRKASQSLLLAITKLQNIEGVALKDRGGYCMELSSGSRVKHWELTPSEYAARGTFFAALPNAVNRNTIKTLQQQVDAHIASLRPRMLAAGEGMNF